MSKVLDTTYRDRRLAERLEDPEFRAEYERARREIAQIDAVMQALDTERARQAVTKAELARKIGKDPASVRRLFSSDSNPGLKTVVSIADALDYELTVKPRSRRRRSKVYA